MHITTYIYQDIRNKLKVTTDYLDNFLYIYLAYCNLVLQSLWKMSPPTTLVPSWVFLKLCRLQHFYKSITAGVLKYCRRAGKWLGWRVDTERFYLNTISRLNLEFPVLNKMKVFW